MKKYKVIHIDFEHPSFKWGNGLYIVLKNDGDELKMCALHKGKPELYEDGRYMISCTGSHNPGISKTDLTYTGKKYE